jgi:cytidylate kinase
MNTSSGDRSAVHDPATGEGDTPRHGFQGNRGERRPLATVPAALTIAVARESGARGGTIGRRVARKLNWQVYDHDLLEYMTQDTVVRQGIFDSLTPPVNEWVASHLEVLLREHNLGKDPSVVNLARVVLALGAQGEVVLIGRGAGFILPRASTLHVRMMAPLQERIAYMSQWLRLPLPEAAEKVRTRDARRAEFINTHFHRQPGDIHQYDMLLNASVLGEETSAALIVQAARARSAQLQPETASEVE